MMTTEGTAPSSRSTSAKFTKWAIFGVLLSLLPLAARILGAILQGKAQLPSFDDLFGDGELLVVATVIAAAGIGEVIFEGRFGVNAISAALAMAFALLVVIFSVLLYGSASLQEEYRKEARDAIALQVVKRNDELRDQAAQLARQQAEIRERERRLQDELTGLGGTGIPGAGELARQHEQQLDDARAEYKSLSLQLETVNKAVLISNPLTAADDAVRGRHEAAVASVIMFPLSLLAGLWCVLTATKRRHLDKLSNQTSLSSNSLRSHESQPSEIEREMNSANSASDTASAAGTPR